MSERAITTPARPLPPGPKRAWWFEHEYMFHLNPLGMFAKWAREHGDFVPIRLGWRKFVMIHDPRAIEQVLVEYSPDTQKHFGLRITRPILGNGLLTSEGDFWLRQRRLAQPAFHPDRLSAHGRVMVEYAKQMVDRWRDGDRLDLTAEIMDLTTRIMIKTLFGTDDPADAAAIRRAMPDAVDGFNRHFVGAVWLSNWVPTFEVYRMSRAVRGLDAVIYRFIDLRRRDGEARDDLLSQLLHARDIEGDGGGMTDRQLRDELMTLFMAGQEMTAFTLIWTLYILCMAPDSLFALFDELKTVIGDRDPSPEDYPKLKYTEALVLEAIRLYPPAYVVGREALRHLEVGGYFIPKGTTMFMSQWVMHRDPRFWTEPEEFLPERWLDGSLADLPKFVYFPFGGGPRGCIGETFAMMQAVLVLATISQRFRFHPEWREPIPIRQSITLRPALRLRTVAVDLQTDLGW